MALAAGRTMPSSFEHRARPNEHGATDLHAHAAASRDVMLRYVGAGLFSTRSLRSGRAYSCAGTGARIAVDPQDVAYLILTRQFARE